LLVTAGTALAVGVRGAAAQQPGPLPRVGWLSGANRTDTAPFFEAFLEGLRQHGHREGGSFVLDARWADYSAERTATLAAEMTASKPAVIVSHGGAVRPLFRLSSPVPVVFMQSGDPVQAGLAESLARPGRGATGISLLALDMIGKRMEILKEIVPTVRRVALLANPEHPGEQRELTASRAAAEHLRLESSYFQARTPAELDAALSAVAAARPGAAVLFSDALMVGQREHLAAFFLKHRIPSATGWASFGESGHLLAYGPNVRAAYARLAYFVDRIIKGARASDLPIELPTVVETVVNRRTAVAMNIAVPPSILARADRIID
jgi:putative ABC transport system substrate-binding protein